ncbi:MAG TPA: peptidoglycan editing factor PgeF [Geminicoccaceae bacterium]
MSELYLQAPLLAMGGGVRHGFFTRRGGVSGAPFDSLNCGFSSGDDPDRVRRNRARALDALGLAPSSLATGRQVHGRDVIVANAPAPDRPARAADALVTDRPGITLGTLGADCAPVLFADPEAGVIGAAHAGWRGALAGVVEATVEAMIGLGAAPDRIQAAVGPCIAWSSYEVGPDLEAEVLAADPGSGSHFERLPDGDRLRFDLKGYVLRRLARAGVGRTMALAEDTLAEPDRFFSSRRTRRAGGERFGLLLSVIALER